MNIKEILDQIANEPSTKKKEAILTLYKDNEVLKQVLYLANSNRIKFGIKIIPEYEKEFRTMMTLGDSLVHLESIYEKQVTGEAAKKKLISILSHLTPDDASVVEKVVKKDLKIALGSRGINKVFPKLIEKENYMGCQPFSLKKIDKILADSVVAISEIKEDGRFANAIVDGDVQLRSRSGEINNFGDAQFVQELLTLDHGMVYNGELLLTKVSDRAKANGIINSLSDIHMKHEIRSTKETLRALDKFHKENGDIYPTLQDALDDIIYSCWDVVSVEQYEVGFADIGRLERLSMLEDILEQSSPENIRVVKYRHVKTKSEAMEHFQEALGLGLEGTILKARTAPWKDGKHPFQVKLKLEIALDLKIVGFKYGNKGTKNENVISSLIVESSCGKLKTDPSGLKEKEMQWVTDNQETLIGSIVEIKCNGLSTNSDGAYSCLSPSFMEFRTDKHEADSLDKIIGIEKSAKGLE